MRQEALEAREEEDRSDQETVLQVTHVSLVPVF